MTDRPIIFSAPMVKALLDGRKTMTRRLAWRDAEKGAGVPVRSTWQRVQPGDRLWVRERCVTITGGQYRGVRYIADGSDCGAFNRASEGGQWDAVSRPSIHMPRWASRLTLTVTATKIERLQEISCADAIAEGIPPAANSQTIDCDTPDPRHAFRDLWNSLHGPDAWAANPEVVAITFTVHKQNIDQLERTAA